MEFNDGGAEGSSSGDLIWLGIDEETDTDPGIAHCLERWLQSRTMGDTVEASLGRDFLTTLRDETDIRGENFQGDRHDLGRVPHLEIQLCPNGLFKPEDVAVDDMTTILTKMSRDPNSPSPLGCERRLDGIGFDVDGG